MFKQLIVITSLIILIIVLAFVLFLREKQMQNNPLISSVSIGNKTLNVERATTPPEMQKGLSGRTELAQNSGMLFISNGLQPIMTFWMKDTLIPLDIIWVKDHRVVGIDQMFPEPNTPENQLKLYRSPQAVDAAIETNLGWTKSNAIKIGDVVNFH